MTRLHERFVRVGPARFRVASAWPAHLRELADLYRDHPDDPADLGVDFTVRLEPTRPWRRYVRPSVAIGGDFWLPDAAPLPLAQHLLAAEMGMNLQMALGWRRHLLLHASTVERGGRALIMTGHSGSGKSTLSAMLATDGWRFMGDEFALLDCATGAVHAFPRLVSLKNEAIPAMIAAAPGRRYGPLLRGTPKGDIRHLVPDAESLRRSNEPATPALLIFPRFGHDAAVRSVAAGETFVRLTQASTNYVALGEPAFGCLTNLVRGVPSRAVDFRSFEEAREQIEQLWNAL